MDISIQLILSVLYLGAVLANAQDKGPQTFEASQPQYAQKYKEVIMYLTPTQIRNYEAGHGLPNVNYEQQVQQQTQYEQERRPQPPISYTYLQQQIPQPSPAYIYTQQVPVTETPIDEEESKIIQSTLDILEANKMQFVLAKQNNPQLEIIRAEEQNSDIRPIHEPNAENEDQIQIQILQKQQEQQQQRQQQQQQQLQQQQYQEEQINLLEQANNQQEQIAKSYAYIKFFSNQKPNSPEKIQLFHPEPHSANLYEEIRLQKDKKIEIQQDPLLREKFKLIPYEYIAEQNIQQKVRDDIFKQGQNQVQQQLFVPAEDQWRPIINPQKEYQQQYAPQFTTSSNNTDIEKLIQQSQLEREAAKIHAENIAKSPPVVIHQDISVVKRRPIHVIKYVNIPYPAPYLHTPYTIERTVPFEVKKEIPVAISSEKLEKPTIIRHVWKH